MRYRLSRIFRVGVAVTGATWCRSLSPSYSLTAACRRMRAIRV
jgi:hypothetical protein